MSEKQTIRVLVVDDHEMVRRGLGMYLRGYEDLKLVGEAASANEAIQLCGELEPDVVLMDIVMPGVSGIEATRSIRQKYPAVQIIALTSASDATTVTDAVQAGATGYLLKSVTDDQLASAIRAIKEGQRVLAPEAAQALLNGATRTSSTRYQLTERETEILSLLVDGLSNAEIGERLYLSRSTIKYHISSLFTKLGVINRSEAISLALKNGLL